ncbi:hypothetical protein LCGC14_1061320 [marine sediment metagenome]|uniref:Uncharacterized protein n=1 Tax=marine sediment metagenome TaxID=412755 RepID=A0A0F9QRY5_9ZZZZ
MKRSCLYIRRCEIVDEYNIVIHKIKEVPIKKGIEQIMNIVKSKDGTKTVKGILSKFYKYLDDDFKKLLNIGDEDE